MSITQAEFLALSPHEQDELVAPLIGWTLCSDFGIKSYRGVDKAFTGCQSIIDGGWAAFGAMWDALPRSHGECWTYTDCGDYHDVGRYAEPEKCVIAPTPNLAVAAALWAAAQKDGV